jgi:hypothetical protein
VKSFNPNSRPKPAIELEDVCARSVYERGLVNAAPHDNLNLHVVVNGVGQTNIDNSTAVLNAGNDWDPMITLDYTTGGSAATGNITVNVYAKEAGINSGFGCVSYKWTVPYEIFGG